MKRVWHFARNGLIFYFEVGSMKSKTIKRTYEGGDFIGRVYFFVQTKDFVTALKTKNAEVAKLLFVGLLPL